MQCYEISRNIHEMLIFNALYQVNWNVQQENVAKERFARQFVTMAENQKEQKARDAILILVLRTDTGIQSIKINVLTVLLTN